MSHVVWSPLAIARVAEAAEFIALDKPNAADRWVDDVFDAVAHLKDFPRSGTVVPELQRDDIREILHGEYRIIYRIDGQRILVLTVRHGRRLLDESEIEQD